MAARHRKSGGKCATGGAALVSGNPNVLKEAREEHKRGGKVGKKLGKVDGKKMKMRMDRPGRKVGGGVGANTSPLSTAHRVVRG